MTDWLDEYAATDDLNGRYRLLRAEMRRLRAQGGVDQVPPLADVRSAVRSLADRVDGDLLVFTANDFGVPAAFRPEDVPVAVQDDVRHAILDEKYDADQPDLAAIRDSLVETFPGIHKVIAAEHDDGAVRYHLPEGSERSTNFLTVREMVGLVDYTTNSAQQDDLCFTY